MDNRETDKLDLEELDQVAGGFTAEQLTPEELDKLNWYRAEAAKIDAGRQDLKTRAFVREYNVYCRYLRQKYGNT